MKKLILFSMFFFVLKLIFAQGSKDKEKIIEVLKTQESNWNKGDIISFMEGYWKSDSLMFIGKAGIVNGWESTKNRYLSSYSNLDKMGKLNFDIQQLDMHGVEYAWVLGKWQLDRPKEGNIGGFFTLVFKKINNRWLIVSDHTS